MAASEQPNNTPNLQINTKQPQLQSLHTYSRSHGQIPQFMRYSTSPISHWGNQYNVASHTNIAVQPQIMQSNNPTDDTNPTDNNNSNNSNNHHKRKSSLSMSYIQQKQQRFFMDNPPAPNSDSDDEIYEDMYKDGLGANNINVKNTNAKKNNIKSSKNKNKQIKKQSKKKQTKSREETEDVWCCVICTYQNNMLLGYCELCGCKKPMKPSIVKRVVFGGKEPSPSPQQPSPNDDIGLFDLNINNNNNNNNNENNNDLLPIPPPKEQHNHTKNKYQHNVYPNNRRSQLQSHRSTKSAPHLFDKDKNNYWECSVCTYASNPIDRPVCKMCSALPPERPPSPNPPIAQKSPVKNIKKINNEIDNNKLDLLPKIENNNNNNMNINDLNEETDPLGHQKSASITELPIMDESVLHKEQNSNSNVFIGFGLNANKNSVKIEQSKQKQQNNSNLANMSSLMVNNQPPSLLNSQGGLGFHNASQSGQNIIRGLPPTYEPDIPDLPEEKIDSLKTGNKNTIANLGVDIAPNNNDNKSGGIGGWFGKVYNGVRRRAQSTENSATLSPNGARSRSKSPRGLKQIREEKNNNSSKRNISVATMPKKQQEKIAKRLNGLHTKKDLLRELDSSQQKLQKKLKQHANRVMQLKSEISVLEQDKSRELKQYTSWYVLELVDIAKEYYSHKLSQINHQIELEKLHIECFSEKLQRLDNANNNIRKHKKWTIDDVRNNIEVAFHTAWRIRLSQDVPDKQDYVKQLKQLTQNLYVTYNNKKATLGKAEISVEERKEQVFLFLQSVLAKYESLKMNENEAFKLSRNLQDDDDFFLSYNETDQNVFDSFVLDQRTKEGRIVSRWLIFIRKKHRDITFEDLSDFMQKLAHTFLHSYSLATKQYYECVRILCFRCILRTKTIKKIIYELLNGINNENDNIEVMHISQNIRLDTIYQKKVMWMRALDEKQLGIKSDYWLKKEIKFNNIQINNLDLPGKQSSQNGRRSSQIALLAGKDIPFAESINLMGQLEVDYHDVEEYKSQTSANNNNNNNNNNISNNQKPRKSFLGRSNKNNSDLDEKNNHSDFSCSKHNVIPFVLPEQALRTLLKATKSIYKNAMKYYYIHYPNKKNDKDDLGAFISQDDLFPIILYCVIQSKLETPHKLIDWIEHILPKEKTTMGQSAFALSALKAAVQYITHAKPESFGMDKEIELD